MLRDEQDIDKTNLQKLKGNDNPLDVCCSPLWTQVYLLYRNFYANEFTPYLCSCLGCLVMKAQLSNVCNIIIFHLLLWLYATLFIMLMSSLQLLSMNDVGV